MVIILGLYLVIWGKSKDLNESTNPGSKSTEEQEWSGKNPSEQAVKTGEADVKRAPRIEDNIV